MSTQTLSQMTSQFLAADFTNKEKFFSNDDETEISKWLKFENDSNASTGSSNLSTLSSPIQTYSAYPFTTSTLDSAPIMGSSVSSFYPYAAPLSAESVDSSSNQSEFAHLNSSAFTFAPLVASAVHSPVSSPISSPISSPPVSYGYSSPQYSSQFSPAQFSSSQYSPSQYGMSASFLSAPAAASGMAPSAYASGNAYPEVTPFYQLYSQFQQIFKGGNGSSSEEIITEDKKRRQVRPFVRRVRQTRPKVVESKGAVQCKGKNRKKGTQCRNAALMEYIGPRPAYCAEHIELDPKSLYEKCKSSYQKEVGDNKGCKEVVLKEFGICYKHFHDMINDIVRARDIETARNQNNRIGELLAQLEREATAAKKKDGDLYQRKNKLIPKFQEMKKLANKAVETLESLRLRDDIDAVPEEIARCSSSPLLGLNEVDDSHFIGSDLSCSSDSDYAEETEHNFYS